jgi:cyclase
MLRPRLIPTLLLDGSRFVKTTKFRNPKYLGDPLNIVRIFNQKEVDEIVILNIAKNGSPLVHDYELISTIASESSAPVTYGGNITSIEEVDQIFNLGIEKVCLKNLVYSNPSIITKIASKYGSQAIMISFDVNKTLFGKYKIFSRSLSRSISIDDLVCNLIECGAGEVLLNAVHKEGTLSGPDFDLIKQFARIPVPLIYNGGISSLNDIKSSLNAGADSVGIGAWFVYHGSMQGVLISYPTKAERDLI